MRRNLVSCTGGTLCLRYDECVYVEGATMEIVVFKDKRQRLIDVKKQIDSRVLEWEKIKHDINPLELVFTFMKGESVSKINPVSRAFFKMIEMLKIIDGDLPKTPLRTLHIAESPGGFIQAINWRRRMLGIVDYMTGWTISKENAWRKLEDTSRSWSTKPILKIGDLLLKNTRDNIIRSHTDCKAFLVTGDGGFDFSDDYESQETMALPLVIAQMATGLECLEKDGIFILKIFDCFTLPMIQILWVFWISFDGFRIIKPRTSRACNSEKYIVARGFKGIGVNLRAFLDKCSQILERIELANRFGMELVSLDTLFESGNLSSWDTMGVEFQTKCYDVISQMVVSQTEWIYKGLNGFKHTKEYKKKMALDWCREHSVPINPEYYEKHCLLKEEAKSDWQENHRHFSLRRRLSSVSPPLVD